MTDVKTEFKDGGVDVSLDSDNNGVEAVGVFGSFQEIYEEILKRGNKIEDYKIVGTRAEGMTVFVDVDTDQDGQPSMVVRINIAEGLNEVLKRFAK